MEDVDKIFWILFVIIGAAVIVSSSVNVIFVDILLGLIIIILGIHKLAQEKESKKMFRISKDAQKKLTHIIDWLEQSHKYAKNINAKAEYRFDKIHKKHQKLDDDIENKFNMVAKRVFELENLLKDISRVLIDSEKVRSGRKKSL